MTAKLVWLFLTSLPDLIKLLQAVEKALKDRETDGKVKDDLKVLRQAFADKDGAKITALFSGAPVDAPKQ